MEALTVGIARRPERAHGGRGSTLGERSPRRQFAGVTLEGVPPALPSLLGAGEVAKMPTFPKHQYRASTPQPETTAEARHG